MSARIRATFLLQSDLAMLEAWGFDLGRMFGHTACLVGSTLTRQGWRDVDVRTILPDNEYDAIAAYMDVSLLHLAVSLWGKAATGLPIDWQLQRMTDANDEFAGRRHPLIRTRHALIQARDGASDPRGSVSGPSQEGPHGF